MRHALVLVLGLFLAAGCASLSLNPAAAPSSTSVGSVDVRYGVDIDAKKAKVMDRYQIPTLMEQALGASFAQGGSNMLDVEITQFRTGAYGPTRMHAVATVKDGSGGVVKQAEADSTSAMGRLQAVVQEIVNELVAQL